MNAGVYMPSDEFTQLLQRQDRIVSEINSMRRDFDEKYSELNNTFSVMAATIDLKAKLWAGGVGIGGAALLMIVEHLILRV